MMARALALASKGVGLVSPGPLVGCVITTAEGEIIGEGHYVYEDLKHAETIALEQAGARARGATAYVSLEPHAHHAKTPPCTDALILAGIRRVVASIEDPNPRVSGKGFDHLRSTGMEVQSGLMAHESAKLNEKYLHFMNTGRPFVHLKMAISLDGKIATRTGDSRWISGPESRARAHELRHEYDAILVGVGTVLNDDPLLTDRSGRQRRNPLVRVVLDEELKISPDSQIGKTAQDSPVIVFSGAESNDSKKELLESRGIEIVSDASGGRDLASVLEQLGSRSLQSVLVEGGANVAAKLLEAKLVNKVTFFIAPLIIGGREAPSAVAGAGVEKIADAFELVDVEVTQLGRDIKVTGYPSVMIDEG